MKYTSAEAGKLIKKLDADISKLMVAEDKASVFRAAISENVESVRPKYDFAGTQAKLLELQEKLRKAKHAINVFNTTHELSGFPGITIDQALVLIPQLRGRASTLSTMARRLPKERVDIRYGSPNIIDYNIVNYDIEEVEREYEKVYAELTSLQLALDTANSTETMEIDVTL